MENLAEALLRICLLLVKILILLLVFFIPGFLILFSSGFIREGDFMTRSDLLINLSLMGVIMAVFYLPLCCLVKSLFPSLTSGKHRNYENLIILFFYIFIVATYIPTINEQIALPIRAMEYEAKQYVSIMNHVQPAYFAENSAFATSVNGLQIGLKNETKYYKYSVFGTPKKAVTYGLSKENKLKNYVGGVFMVPAKDINPNAGKDEIKTISILCEADEPGTIKPAEPTYQNGNLACGTGTTEVTK
jgi:type IV pilus assembly protein PilA